MKHKLTYLLLLTLPFLWSCEDKIDLEVPEGDVKLVVDGIMIDLDTVHTVTISRTSPYFSNVSTPRVSGALVYLSTSEGDTLPFSESSFGDGSYIINLTLKEEVEYVLNIVTPDGRRYQTFPEELHRVPPIDSLYQGDEFLEEVPDFREPGYEVNLATREPEGRGDNYKWNLYVNGEKLINPFTLYVIDDRLIDGNPITDWDMIDGVIPGDVVLIEQLSISKRAFQFWYLLGLQLQNIGTPFDTPPAQIEGNVYSLDDPDETVLGFFGVSRASRASILIVQK